VHLVWIERTKSANHGSFRASTSWDGEGEVAMRFDPTPLAGAFIVTIEPHADVRGYFARTWCSREFGAQGLATQIVQTSISHNLRRGTVRGMHLQLPPSQEGKLVSCLSGAIHDVIIDMRPQSPTYLQYFGIDLTAGTHAALYVPPLMAHGFQTLADGTEVLYQMSDFFGAELAFGVRWNDSAFEIRWPIDADIVILTRDATYPDFVRKEYERSLAAAYGPPGVQGP
jgi:dTDP-4-dehydrorhamnose 3,5-epimerase